MRCTFGIHHAAHRGQGVPRGISRRRHIACEAHIASAGHIALPCLRHACISRRLAVNSSVPPSPHVAPRATYRAACGISSAKHISNCAISRERNISSVEDAKDLSRAGRDSIYLAPLDSIYARKLAFDISRKRDSICLLRKREVDFTRRSSVSLPRSSRRYPVPSL